MKDDFGFVGGFKLATDFFESLCEIGSCGDSQFVVSGVVGGFILARGDARQRQD
jgi:hypothetical protein